MQRRIQVVGGCGIQEGVTLTGRELVQVTYHSTTVSQFNYIIFNSINGKNTSSYFSIALRVNSTPLWLFLLLTPYSTKQ